jgi:Uma2 family endonuclease
VSMPALQFDDDAPVFDPDCLKMPENAAHRRVVDVVALAATQLLGPAVRIFRDLNWYPTDGGNAVAPDIMVLAASAVEADPTSYRQDQSGGPPPLVVMEVPSPTDTFVQFRAKTFRYQELGTTVYLIVIGGSPEVVLRLGPEDSEPQAWTNRPVDELGGLRLGFDDGELVVTTPDGLRATSDGALLAQSMERAATAEDRATAAEERAQALARQLEALGVEPQTPPDAEPC